MHFLMPQTLYSKTFYFLGMIFVVDMLAYVYFCVIYFFTLCHFIRHFLHIRDHIFIYFFFLMIRIFFSKVENKKFQK